jgi:hypothetical protein
MNPLEACMMYIALKTHFKSDKYSYFKYRGKVRIGNFSIRKDRFYFYKLSKKDDLENLIISNIVYRDEDFWVGDLLDPASEDYYKEYVRRRDSLTYLFTSDLKKVSEWKKSIKIVDGENPFILTSLYNSDIMIESFCILNFYLSFFDYISRNIHDDILWPKIRMKCEKYTPFIKYDGVKIKKLLLENLE